MRVQRGASEAVIRYRQAKDAAVPAAAAAAAAGKHSPQIQ